jgi:hypothetical protein
MDVDIHREHEHYVVYIQGEFYCSVDTFAEAAEEVRNYSEQLAS